MKPIDVSEKVMQNIERFEDSRTRSWIRKFYFIIGGLGVAFGISVWINWKIMSDLQSWELLRVFTQDQEIIREYWQDTLMTFFEELPFDTLTIAACVLIIVVMCLIMTKKRRKINTVRLVQLAKRSRIAQNKETRR